MSSSAVMSEKQRDILHKLKAELGEVDKLTMLSNKSQTIIRAAMLNNGVATMKFLDHINWSGSVVGSYPPQITMNHSRSTSHQGVPPKDTEGSMGAVVFVGPNVQDGTDDCAWVLAWSVPGNDTGNKIFVETGPSSRYPKDKIDWADIKGKLEGSTFESSCQADHGAEASASIDPKGNHPKAAATFIVNNVE